MKLSIRYHSVNATVRHSTKARHSGSRLPAYFLPLVLGGVLIGCLGPIVKPSSFPLRPTTTRPGSVLGPFVGRVIDSDTRKPIEGAGVVCSWAFERGLGSSAPEAARTFTTKTDPDGRYNVPRLKDLPVGLTTRLASMSLLIHSPGYVAYRHDHTLSGQRRLDFSQLTNVVALSRWSPELSPAEHLIFVGGSQRMRQLNRDQLFAAAAELDRRGSGRVPQKIRRSPPPRRESPAAMLLSSDDVRTVTGFAGRLRAGLLPRKGDAASTIHYRATDKPERYDVALRLWRLSGAELSKKYEALLNALPGSKQTDEVADRSFVVAQGEIVALGMMDSSSSALVLITCGRGQCRKPEHLVALGKRAAARLSKLPPPSEPGKEP